MKKDSSQIAIDYDSSALLFSNFPLTDRSSTITFLKNFLKETKGNIGNPSYEFLAGQYRHDIFTLDVQTLVGQRSTNPDWIVEQLCMRSANCLIPLSGKITLTTGKLTKEYLIQGSRLSWSEIVNNDITIQ